VVLTGSDGESFVFVSPLCSVDFTEKSCVGVWSAKNGRPRPTIFDSPKQPDKHILSGADVLADVHSTISRGIILFTYRRYNYLYNP
jgi:hypothetical protein